MTRAQLRRLVLLIMARHEGAFLQCNSASELVDMTEQVVSFVRVDRILIEMLNFKHDIAETARGPLWPSVVLAGLGAALACDMSSPLGLVMNVACTAGGAVSGFVCGASQSAQWSAEAAVLTNRGWMLHSDADASQAGSRREASEEMPSS